jgi:hypothetical protein
MLKAIVSYSKKIPVPEAEYSSQGYSLSLETEIPETDPVAIQGKLSETFRLVKTQVEHELANGNGSRPGLEDSGSNSVPLPPPHGAGKATNRQIKFITDLAGRQGISISDLNGRIRERFGLEGLYDLDKKQASTVLDLLNGAEKKAA